MDPNKSPEGIRDTFLECEARLRNKYTDILNTLTLEELTHFNKFTYKNKIMKDFAELMPSCNQDLIEISAHYLSNGLNNDISDVRGRLKADIKAANTKPNVQSASGEKASSLDLAREMMVDCDDNEHSGEGNLYAADDKIDPFTQTQGFSETDLEQLDGLNISELTCTQESITESQYDQTNAKTVDVDNETTTPKTVDDETENGTTQTNPRTRQQNTTKAKEVTKVSQKSKSKINKCGD